MVDHQEHKQHWAFDHTRRIGAKFDDGGTVVGDVEILASESLHDRNTCLDMNCSCSRSAGQLGLRNLPRVCWTNELF